MRHVLCGDPTQDKQLAAALAALNYTESAPVLRPGHPVWDSADREFTGSHGTQGVAFVPIDTTSPRSRFVDISSSLMPRVIFESRFEP